MSLYSPNDCPHHTDRGKQHRGEEKITLKIAQVVADPGFAPGALQLQSSVRLPGPPPSPAPLLSFYVTSWKDRGVWETRVTDSYHVWEELVGDDPQW